MLSCRHQSSLHARGRNNLCGLRSCAPAPPVVVRRSRCSIVTVASASGASIPGVTSSTATPGGQPIQGLWQRWSQWWMLESPTDSSEAETGIKRTPLTPLLKRIAALVAPDKLLLSAAVVFMVAAALAELAVPHYATSCIFSAAAAGATTATFQGTLKLLASLIIFYGIMSACRGYCFSILNNRMTKRLRTQLFANLVRRETAFFDSTDTGSLTSRLQADCQAMTKCVATNLNIAFRNMLQAIGGVIYLAVTSPTMCAATIGVCVILWSITLFYGEYARRTQKVFQDTLACGNQVADEVLSLSRVVRTFGTEQQEEKRYSSWLDRLYNVGLRQATGYGMFVASGHIACYMTKVVALTLGCALLVQGKLTAEQLTNFIFYVEFVTYASLSACDEIVEVFEAVGASERVMQLLQAPPAAQVSSGVVPDSFTGHVKFQGVGFRYPTRPKHAALTDVDLELKPGQLVALVGLSGSGKTTLVALLQRLYDPVEGAILVDGHDLKTLDAAWFRSQIGVVSQEPHLFGTTIAANISYGCASASQPDIESAAKEANAHEFIMSLPKGYDTVVTDKLLSGGQKQRIALARALVRKPKLLILDEATSALDADSEAQVQQALDAAMRSRERTVIVIAHRLSTVRNADVTVVMDKGQIVERGTHTSLLRQRGIYYRLVSKQQYTKQELEQHQAELEQEQRKQMAASAPAVLSASAAVGGRGEVSQEAGRELQEGARNLVMGNAGADVDFEALSDIGGITDDSSMLALGSTDELLDASSSSVAENSSSVAREILDHHHRNGNGHHGHIEDRSVVHHRHQHHSSGSSHRGSHHGHGQQHRDEDGVALAVAAAAAVTAENELSSKVLGSQDPIDHTASGN